MAGGVVPEIIVISDDEPELTCPVIATHPPKRPRVSLAAVRGSGCNVDDDEIVIVSHTTAPGPKKRRFSVDEEVKPSVDAAQFSAPKAEPICSSGADDDELTVVATTQGVRALIDFAHNRFQCAVHPFSISTAISFCPKCFCYICDVECSKCESWPQHACANDKEPKWRKMRKCVSQSRKSEAETSDNTTMHRGPNLRARNFFVRVPPGPPPARLRTPRRAPLIAPARQIHRPSPPVSNAIVRELDDSMQVLDQNPDQRSAFQATIRAIIGNQEQMTNSALEARPALPRSCVLTSQPASIPTSNVMLPSIGMLQTALPPLQQSSNATSSALSRARMPVSPLALPPLLSGMGAELSSEAVDSFLANASSAQARNSESNQVHPCVVPPPLRPPGTQVPSAIMAQNVQNSHSQPLPHLRNSHENVQPEPSSGPVNNVLTIAQSAGSVPVRQLMHGTTIAPKIVEPVQTSAPQPMLGVSRPLRSPNLHLSSVPVSFHESSSVPSQPVRAVQQLPLPSLPHLHVPTTVAAQEPGPSVGREVNLAMMRREPRSPSDSTQSGQSLSGDDRRQERVQAEVMAPLMGFGLMGLDMRGRSPMVMNELSDALNPERSSGLTTSTTASRGKSNV